MPTLRKKHIRWAKTINRWARGTRSMVEELIREWRVYNVIECVTVTRTWNRPTITNVILIDEFCEARVYDKIARQRDTAWVSKLIRNEKWGT